ncbi:MAG: ATP-binding protein [Deltaproteobacteria bacterium]|nr:MAG: ATP-binding protein [Deltaproteobacteria bacterium]
MENKEEHKKKKDQVMVILVGNIGCGKTTLSRKYADKKYIVVSRDGLRSMIDGDRYKFDVELESLVYDVETYAIELFLRSGYNIVVDETNTSLRSRRRLLMIAEDHNVQTLVHVLPGLNKKECVERRMKSNRGYTKEKWEEIWNMFDKNYIEPDYKEGFDWILREPYPKQTLGRLIKYGYKQNA